MRRTIKILCLLFLLFPFFAVSCSSSEEENIVAVHDGDTFTDSSGTIYRLFGVDTPEVSDQYNNFKPTEGIEAIYGEEATVFARKLILNHNCKLNKITTDPYQRTVASISYEGKDLAIGLLKAGLARVAYISTDIKSNYYTSNFKYYRELLDAQYDAFKNKKGIWERNNEMARIFPKASL